MIRWFQIASILLCFPGSALADVIHLKGGASFTGRIVEQTDKTVSIDLGDGVVGVSMDRVERIEKKRSPLDEFDERAAKLKPENVDGWRSLGQWAAQQGLNAQARRAWESVLTYAPDDPIARAGLGFVLFEGRWLTEEEGYRAQGYVKYEGEWMTPAEAQMAQAAAGAEQARQDAERRATDAEIAAQEAESRAQEAEQRAADAQSAATQDPIYWNGWGYGMSYWPTYSVTHWPAYRPAQLPGRRPR
jgi:hypothetical protein